MENQAEYKAAVVAQSAAEAEKIQEFISEVRAMRKAQKAYFAAERGTSAKANALHESKRLEGRVDFALKEMEAGQTQTSLFK